MNLQIFKLSLIMTYGRQAFRPLRAALIRLGIMMIGMAGLSILAVRAVGRLTLPVDLPLSLVTSFAAVSTFGVCGIVVLVMSTVLGSFENTYKGYLLISVWPLRRRDKWVLYIGPYVMIGAILLILFVPIAFTMAKSMEHPSLILISMSVYGTMASIGFLLAIRSAATWFKTGLFVAFVASLVRMIELSISQSSVSLLERPYILLHMLLAIATIGWIFNAFYPNVIQHKLPRSRIYSESGKESIRLSWFLLKLVRNHRFIRTLSICLILNFIIALTLHLRGLVYVAGTGWYLLGSILAAVSCSEIRGLMRNHLVPEVEDLRGVGFLVRNEAVSACLVSICIGLPFAAVMAWHFKSTTQLSFYVSLQCFAGISGLLSSTVFVPQASNLGAQFFATASSTGLLLAFPRLARFGALNSVQQNIAWLAAALFCLPLIQLIELIRRSRYGYVRT